MPSRLGGSTSSEGASSLSGPVPLTDCIEWFKDRVILAFRVKDQEVKKMMQHEENSIVVESFFNTDTGDHRTLFVHQNGPAIIATLEPPVQTKKKFLYIVKQNGSGSITSENSGGLRSLLSGELPPMQSFLEYMSTLGSSVWMTFVSSKENHKGLPELASRSLIESVHSFISDTNVSLGLTQGKTILPLPMVESFDMSQAHSNRVHILEGSVVNWSHQIKNVLHMDPEAPLKSSHKPFPGPLVELEFWHQRATDLSSILEQLRSDSIQKVVHILEASQSTYFTSFLHLVDDVEVSFRESASLDRVLQPMRPYFEQLDPSSPFRSDFTELVNLFPRIIHLIHLIWRSCEDFRSPTRLVCLMREICNDVVSQASGFVDVVKIFELEPDEAANKLRTTLSVCSSLKEWFFRYKSKIAEATPESRWVVNSSAMFSRLDHLMERCNDIRFLCDARVQFSALKDIEIGGSKGSALTANVRSIYDEFVEALSVFQDSASELLDVTRKQFEHDFYSFRNTIKELEKRLGSTLSKGFDDCSSIFAAFKLVESFEGLVDREMIRVELEKKQAALLRTYGADLQLVQEIFQEQRNNPPRPSNMPPTAGAILWSKGMLDRVVLPMQNFRRLQMAVMQSDEALDITRLHDSLLVALVEYQQEKYREWASSVCDGSTNKLENHLLRRDSDSQLVYVNFDQSLLRLLREVQYVDRINEEESRRAKVQQSLSEANSSQSASVIDSQEFQFSIPADARHVFSMNNELRTYIAKLEMVVHKYNKIVSTLLDVERPLLSEILENIDLEMEEGISVLTWLSPGITEFIEKMENLTNQASSIVSRMKESVEQTKEILESWVEMPLTLDRKDAKLCSLESYQQKHADLRNLRFQTMERQARRIHDNLRKSFHALPHISSDSLAWKNYAAHVNNIVVEGLIQVAAASLSHLQAMINPRSPELKEYGPILELNLRLITVASNQSGRFSEDKAEFSPALTIQEDPTGGSLESALRSWIDDFLSISLVLHGRLDVASIEHVQHDQVSTDGGKIEEEEAIIHSSSLKRADSSVSAAASMLSLKKGKRSKAKTIEDIPLMQWKDYVTSGEYSEEIRSSPIVRELIDSILQLFFDNVKQCQEVKSKFLQFSFLWTKNERESFEEFLESSPKESEISKEPLLSAFKQKYDFFDDITQQIQSCPRTAVCSWIRIDSSPLRSSLQSLCASWRDTYTQYLQDRVHDTLTELSSFMETISEGIEKPVDENNIAVLKEVMGYFRSVLDREEEIQASWEPMRQIADFLKREDAALPDSLLVDLDNMPFLWNKLYGRVLSRRGDLAPYQNAQAEKIKQDSESFHEEIRAFRARFEREAPFRWDVGPDAAYDSLDRIQLDLASLESRNASLMDLQSLFGLQPLENRLLAICRADLVNLKLLWDMTSIVMTQFRSWMKTSFRSVDVDELMEQARQLQMALRSLSSEMKSYNVYLGLDKEVTNMLTSLPMIMDLRNPAMRPRHWDELLRETGKANMFGGRGLDPDDESFDLEQLMSLGLHDFVEEVETIVDKANKQLVIERNLKKIEDTWQVLQLEYTFDHDLDSYLVKVGDDIIDAVDEQQTLLQGMAGSRHVDVFEEKVNYWNDVVFAVDEGIRLWTTVQGKWANLYPIFVLSEDIRVQLQQDARRFEGIDGVFRRFMKAAHGIFNVAEACSDDTIQRKMDSNRDFTGILSDLESELQECEKALSNYLETKRKIFPRFYFVSPADLVDILSKGSIPHAIMRHMSKLVDSIDTLIFETDPEGEPTKTAIGLISREGEEIMFHRPFVCDGPVEKWLGDLIIHVRETLRNILSDAATTYSEPEREQALDLWLASYPAQLVVLVSRVWWTRNVDLAFAMREEGNVNSMKDYNRTQVDSLASLAALVRREEISAGERKKIITLITIEVHARDVVASLIASNADNRLNFQWQSQLRYAWDDDLRRCTIDIGDAQFNYGYEYIGNCGCLVITPLTDRCYITLTQALRLIQGGAPAGPAGTGKTETTKDLGRALGMPVYVFNCSEQMDVDSLGNIFKGLCMTGAWGCFDEFNRILIEVLSVVATQVKSILDAIASRQETFPFQDDVIPLVPTVGAFITMNPGYKGRTELPENLKALFRPCAMVVPDLLNICEIMLASEGFESAKPLAKKFVTLYMLNRELLSKQDHYDWGLRAVKSVLVIAGGLKRAEPDIPEEKILMRALRDTNMAKLARDDVEIFRGLIDDLFPEMDLPPKQDAELEDAIRTASHELHLQLGEKRDGQTEMFVLKCVQFKELLDVRHSVFILGPAGTSKTSIWKSLSGAFGKMGKRVAYHVINPKAVTSNELYGYVHKPTGDWRDGLLSVVMRNFADDSKRNKNPKWIVLDGDIDADWIESMNTVMDDNKVLTLASNERISLTPSMRMLFEINHLRNATPATVSRAGILFVNESDIGWIPFRDSWIDRQPEKWKSSLLHLFDNYIPETLDWVKRNCKFIVPISDFQMVQTLCRLLEGVFRILPPDTVVDVFEHYFVFCAIWAIGGALSEDGGINYRMVFSKHWIKEFGGSSSVVRFPDQASVFDFYIDPDDRLKHWDALVPHYIHDPDAPFSSIFVPTVDTTRLEYLASLLLNRDDAGYPLMLVGTAGTGKTAVMRHKLFNMGDDFIFRSVNFNASTDSAQLQLILEQNIEKQGREYGPPGRKRCIFFLDDLNMPTPDKYGTQSAISLLRQHIDYGFWYDRLKQEAKHVRHLQYVACMNPKSGSFTVSERLQRHFAIFSVLPPSENDVSRIFKQILDGHFVSFDRSIREDLPRRLVQSTIHLHQLVSRTFVPTSIKFHYIFTLRELSNVFQGICLSRRESYHDPGLLVRLWQHECSRVYGDRLVDKTDQDIFESECMRASITEHFRDYLEVLGKVERNVFTGFIRKDMTGNSMYFPIDSLQHLREVLDDKLHEYNSTGKNAEMNLEMFEQAMEHVCRIARIISNPRGNALLVGVGGSGKQSLSRLASFIFDYEVHSIVVRASYTMADFKADVISLYHKAAIKPGTPRVFMLTDSQIIDEHMLVYINDMLSSGNVPDLFSSEEKQDLISTMSTEVKQQGVGDYNNRDFVWEYFINKVRNNLHIILCFSPVGEQFRVRARKFPALSSCTVIDWFQPWPVSALVSVADRFLRETDLGDRENIHRTISEYLAHVHNTVEIVSHDYLLQQRRYNYTTPKSFLETITLYKRVLGEKRAELEMLISRLDSGLTRLNASSEKVAILREDLQRQQVHVAEKVASTQELMDRVATRQKIVNEEKAIADAERVKADALQKEANDFRDSAQEDLERTVPIVQQALAALDTLDKKNITEMKALGRPPAAVVDVAAAVYILTSKTGVPKSVTWNDCKIMMKSPEGFVKYLREEFDIDNIPQANVDAISKYVKDEENFNPAVLQTKSYAAGGLCAWTVAIVQYHNINLEVKPLKEQLRAAEERLTEAQESLRRTVEKVNGLQSELDKLVAEFEEAKAESDRLEEEARQTAGQLDLAERLVNGLADERYRWANAIEDLNNKRNTLVGDCLIAAAFLSYIGPFSRKFRERLLHEFWFPALSERSIPSTPELDVLMNILTDEAEIARWTNQGLPADRISQENGAIVSNCTRWPLLIDPQLQAVKWIKNKEANNDLKVIQLSKGNYMRDIKMAVENGNPVLIENISEEIDAVLDPIISRNTIRRGRNEYVILGEEEVLYNKNFRLYLQTKLPNPHYRPEISAQTTIINFTVTEDGLEEQLLAVVVNNERPDLELRRVALIKQMNQDKIELKNCEDSLLEQLNNVDESEMLRSSALVESLENTKKKSHEIRLAFEEATRMNEEISLERNRFRLSAVRGSLMFFLIDQLSMIDHMYQFSLESFMTIFKKGLEKSRQAESVEERVKNIVSTTTETLFAFVARGLFEAHKLIFSSMLTFNILRKEDRLNDQYLQFLLRGPTIRKQDIPPIPESCITWLPQSSWEMVVAIGELEGGDPPFSMLKEDIASSWRRFKEWCEMLNPEDENLPSDWKNLSNFDRLLVVKCLRPDRITNALSRFVKLELGSFFVEDVSTDLPLAYQDSAPTTPIFFILSPGVDPVKNVEALARQHGFSREGGNFWYVSLGQKQDRVAERALDTAYRNGGWVMLNNIHLMSKWLLELEKIFDRFDEGYDISKLEGVDSAPPGHAAFRVFLSAEPSEKIPIGILQRCIKLTNEPPSGLRANVQRALANFKDEVWEQSPKQAEFKSILFAVCFFHGVVIERKKFGPQGWNRSYPFNFGDLLTCVQVLSNYLDERPTPWEDLRYVFGEIMYGGHITDDWDRRLCKTYLEEYLRSELVDGALEFFEDFYAPNPSTGSLKEFRFHVDDGLSYETPKAFGLPASAEIGYRTKLGEELFKSVMELLPRGSGISAADEAEKLKSDIQDYIDGLPPQFPLADITERLEERDPFQNVFLQECERMNKLLSVVKNSLEELKAGLNGELSISEPMEKLQHFLLLDRVPEVWESVAYPSLRPLRSWLINLQDRYLQLQDWTSEYALSKVVWISGFFNPQSFLTAIMQTTARKNKQPLDKMLLLTEVTKKTPDKIESAPREGWYISGLYLEGASWDILNSCLEESELKNLYPEMPVIHARAVNVDEINLKDQYLCPVYKTQDRGATYVCTAQLKTKKPPSRWVLAGTALLLDVV